MRKICASLILVLLVFIAFSAAQTTSAPKKANARPVKPTTPGEPFDKASVETMSRHCVRFETEKGAIEMEMFPESAPESVRNFLNLVSRGAFDTTVFNRVVPGFVIQGGDIGTRRAEFKPGLLERAQRTIPDEPSQIRHERGILSMARSDEPNSASSHFFILVRDASFLDGKFAAFGRVTKGMETVDAINKMPVRDEKPDRPVRIARAVAFPCTNGPTPQE